ncbi:MAG TPA: cytochrome P460 family protein [Pyrinomonadaceae bacterium]|nr:cytochrome P460 family protein [Pyrinomonadaceae bacterium]
MGPVVDGPRIIGGGGTTRFIFPRPGEWSNPEPVRKQHTFGVVYANDIALEAMNATPRSSFRPGSMIVRAKLSHPESETPDLLAVMIKRAKGFNPAANDWEFLIVNGTASRIQKRQKKGACFACHQSQQDFVYGNYERKEIGLK